MSNLVTKNEPLYAALLELGCNPEKAKAAAEACPAIKTDLWIKMHGAQLAALMKLDGLRSAIRLNAVLLAGLVLLGVLHGVVDVTKLNTLLGQ